MRVIIVSARRDEATVREAVRSKCDGFVVKPFRLKDLAQRIAMELFTITHQEIRILCRDLVTIRTNVFREKGFEEFNSQLWDPYPVKYREMMLCVMLPRGIRPAHFARALDEELEKRVVLLLKHPGKWKKIFPPKRYV